MFLINPICLLMVNAPWNAPPIIQKLALVLIVPASDVTVGLNNICIIVFIICVLTQCFPFQYSSTGSCKKVCTGANIDSIESIKQMRGCTHITGALEIHIRSQGGCKLFIT